MSKEYGHVGDSGILHDEYCAGDSDIACACAEPEEITGVQYAEGFTFVCVYEVDRIYGGPEEGGWYYDAGRIVECRQVPEESAGRVTAELQAKYPKTGDSSSVVYSGGDYRVWLQDEPGRDYPEYTPHYE